MPKSFVHIKCLVCQEIEYYGGEKSTLDEILTPDCTIKECD
jgi:predicted nucleic-acid-binding Zn-ribbon protein